MRRSDSACNRRPLPSRRLHTYGEVNGPARKRLELALKMAAPYLAVGVFWCLLHNAWLAILAYHGQIL